MSATRTTRVRERLCLALFPILLSGCATTPLDVLEVLPANGGTGGDVGNGGSGGGSGAFATCPAAPAPLTGTYRLRSASSGKCIDVGASTTVGNLPARLTVMVNDCSERAESFQLIADSSFDSFQLRATSINNYTLDIEMAGTADGTRVILFAPTGYGNQRFSFQARRERVFAIIPAHADSSCITEVTPQPEIFACKSELRTQEWELIPANCD